MPHATLARRADLFSQTQAARLLGLDRHTVRGLVLALKMDYKIDPTRAGKMLDRGDVDSIARTLGVRVDWDALGD